MVSFDHRGHNNIVLWLLVGWLLLGFIGGLAAVFLQKFMPLHRPVVPPPKQAPKSWRGYLYDTFVPRTLGHIIVIGWIVGYLLLCFFYMLEHAAINNLVGKTGRALGSVAAGLLSLILLPVSRKSILLAIFGIPFERALAAHRTLGTFAFWMASAHGLAMEISYIVVYGNYVNCSRWYGLEYMFRWKVQYPHGPPLAGVVAWVFMAIIFLSTFIRRYKWEVFLVVHLGSWVIVLIFSIIHYETFLVMLGLPLLVYTIDVLYRTINVMVPETTLMEQTPIATADGGMTMLKIRKSGLIFRPGQWVLLKVKPIDRFVQWHPFSISSYDGQYDDGTFTVHIKNMGPNTWTGKLHRTELGANDVQVDGPFGELSVPLEKYSTILLAAGGIGVTPFMNIIGTACKQGRLHSDVRVTFVWVVKDFDDVAPFHDALKAFPSMLPAHQYSCFVYATRTKDGKSAKEAPTTDMDSLKKQLSTTGDVDFSHTDQTLPQAEPLPYMANHGLPAPTPAQSPASHYVPMPNAEQQRGDTPLDGLSKPKYVDLEMAQDTYVPCSGRPNWRQVFEDLPEGRQTAVLTCGPGPLVAEVERLAWDCGMDFHKEVFSF
jgi:predicted ferric reductase